MRFDIDITGRWLGTGDQAGHLLVYDLAKASGPTEPQHDVETVEVEPACKVEAHGGMSLSLLCLVHESKD